MMVLELFCGMGGWSKPWIEQGHDVTGIDFEDFSKDYPGKFIKADLLDWEPKEQYDVVLASPPCTEFSIAKKWGWGTQNEMKGLDLIWRTFHLIEKIKPKYWVIENVVGLSEFLPGWKDAVKYNRHKNGKTAFLWGNFPKMPMFDNMIEYRAQQTKPIRTGPINGGGRKEGSKRKQLTTTFTRKEERALIPYPLAKSMCNSILNDEREEL